MSTDDAFIPACSGSFIRGFMLNKGFPDRNNALPVVRIFLTAAKGYAPIRPLKRLLTIIPLSSVATLFRPQAAGAVMECCHCAYASSHPDGPAVLAFRLRGDLGSQPADRRHRRHGRDGGREYRARTRRR